MFTFADFFAGIGGMRTGFEKAGGNCVFSCEWDRFCQLTYETNFGEKPAGDIRKINKNDIPDHDILLAGFPCQPFSIAGVSKKISLGRKHGFQDKKQGNLFFELAGILSIKRPKAFLLENVKNLVNHDGGKTYAIITETLYELGYKLYAKIIDGAYYVPQHRERIFLVGFRNDVYKNIEFNFPSPKERLIDIADILEMKVPEKYTLSYKLWNYLQNYARKHRLQGNGFGFGMVDPKKDFITRTLSARYHKDGSEILIKQKRGNPRRLTPRECARLMGFDDSFKIPVSDTQAYKQFGNSVIVPVVEAVAREIVKSIMAYGRSINKQAAELEYVPHKVNRHSTRTDTEEIFI